jgi:hypothetical protein
MASETAIEDNQEHGRLNEISVFWPFAKYDVLIPKEIQTDVFVWLFLSLVMYENDIGHKDRLSFGQESIDGARALIRSKFGSTIDHETLAKIEGNVRKGFVVTAKDQGGKSGEYLKDESLTFVDTFQDLFSDLVQVKPLYQDLVTGEVLPYFSEYGIQSPKNPPAGAVKVTAAREITLPSPEAIKRAVRIYNAKLGQQAVGDISDEGGDLIDPDQETFFDDPEVEQELPEQDEKVKGQNFNVKFIDNSKRLFYFEVRLLVSGNKIFCRQPVEFPSALQGWFDGVFLHAVNEGGSVKAQYDLLAPCLEQTGEEAGEALPEYGKDPADQVGIFGDLYRAVSNSKGGLAAKMGSSVKEMYFKWISHDLDYYTAQGRLLEGLMIPLLVNRSPNESLTIETFRALLSKRGQEINVDTYQLGRPGILSDYCRGKEAFKADFARMILSNQKIAQSQFRYYEFVTDVLKMYDDRNTISAHFSIDSEARFSDETVVQKITKAARLFIDIQ